jgi:hypothetical protein
MKTLLIIEPTLDYYSLFKDTETIKYRIEETGEEKEEKLKVLKMRYRNIAD